VIDANAVQEGFVVLIRLEDLPFRFVGVSKDNAIEGDGTERFGADIVAFLGRGEQGMQHFDRGLEHFDEFEETLIGMAKPAGKRITRPDRSG